MTNCQKKNEKKQPTPTNRISISFLELLEVIYYIMNRVGNNTIKRGGYRLFSSQRSLLSPDTYSVTTYARPSIILSKGKGSEVWDTTGKRYIDFSAGIAVNGLGHCEPNVAKIYSEQGQTLVHGSNLWHNEWAGKLSKSLVEQTIKAGSMPNASKVFLCNSGTEANEAALKFARKYGKQQRADKTELVSFTRGFHGRTMGALSVTANDKYQEPFLPLVPNIKRGGEINQLDGLNELINDNTCGVIVEPIQGEGGVYECSEDFLSALRERCDEVGALLIYDEIQCGLGRTGKLWAHGQTAPPDILTMAKALGNGFPIGATLVTESVDKAMKIGDHGTTYGGNPLGCRIGDYVVNKISTSEILEGVSSSSKVFQDRFTQWQKKYPNVVDEQRGKGLLLGLQLKTNPAPIVKAANEKGLLVITCGVNTLRFVPPLNISEKLIKEGLDILEKALEENN